MRKLLLLIGLLIATTSYSQKCYSVTSVENNGDIEGINPKKAVNVFCIFFRK